MEGEREVFVRLCQKRATDIHDLDLCLQCKTGRMLVAVNDWSVTHVTCHGHSLTLQFLLSTPTLCARTDLTSYLPRWQATQSGKHIKKTEGWRREREREEEGGKQCENEDQDKGEALRTCAVHSSPPFALSSADISHGDSVDNLSPCKMSIASGLPPSSLHPTGNFAVLKRKTLDCWS